MTTASGIVNCAAYAAGRRISDVEIHDIKQVLETPDRFVWIGLHEPSPALMAQVQQAFGLHDLAVEDALRAHQRPKLERYQDSLFLVLRTAQMNREAHRIEFGETHLFVGERYVVSVRHGASMSYADVRARCEATPQLLAKGPGFVLHALIDALLGAARLGDVGTLFPSDAEAWSGVDSAELLRRTLTRLAQSGWRPIQADLAVAIERPAIGPRREEIEIRVAELLGIGVEAVAIKGTTSDGLGFTAGGGIAAWAIAGVAPAT